MTKNVLLSNAQGNLSVELPPEDARRIIEMQRVETRRPTRPFGMSQAHAATTALECLAVLAPLHCPAADGPSYNMHGMARRETLSGYQRNGKGTIQRETARLGRNDPCRCGCGRKVKHCRRSAP